MYTKDGKNELQEWSLTEEEVKSVAGFEDASDEHVELIRQTLTLLSLAMFESELNKN